MAEFKITIVVDTSGAVTGINQVKRQLRGLQAQGAAAGLTMKKLLKALAVEEAVRRLIRLSDAYTNIRNKIGTVTTSVEESTAVLEDLFNISQKTRSGFEDIVTSYQRSRNATHELGLTTKQSLRFHESLSKAILVSGANARETSNGMLDLNHALAEGYLHGRQFRAISQQLPVILDIIAKHTKKTRGELQEMAVNAEITSKVIIESFAAAGDEIDQRFAKLTPTIEQGFTVIHNALLKFVGELSTSSGAGVGFANMLIFVGEHMDTFGKIGIALAQTLGTVLVVNGIQRLMTALRALTALMATNPFTAFLLVLLAVVALLRQFGDQIDLGKDSIATLADVFAELWDRIKSGLSAVTEGLKRLLVEFIAIFNEFIDVSDLTFKNILVFIATFVDSAYKIFVFLKDIVITVFSNLGPSIGEVFIDVIQKVLSGLEAAVNKIVSGINSVAGKVGLSLGPGVDFSFKNPFEGANEGAANELVAAYEKLMTPGGPVQDAVLGFMDDVEARAAARIANIGKKVEDLDEGGGGAKDREKASKELEDLRKKLEALRDALFPVEQANREFVDTVLLLEKAMAAHLITEEEYNNILQRQSDVLQDQLDPYAALTKEIEAQTYALGLDEEQRDRHNKILEYQTQLQGDGIYLTKAQRTELNNLLDAQEQQVMVNKLLEDQKKREQAAIDAVRGEAMSFNRDLATGNKLLEEGTFTTEEYNKYLEILRQRYASILPPYEAVRNFNEGLRDGLLSIQKTIFDTGSMVEQTLTNAFSAVEDAMVELATTGKISFHSLVQSILADLTRLLFRQGLMNLLGWLGAGLGGGGLSPLAVGGGANVIGDNLMNPFTGHATGGDFRVGGSGGTDSQLVAFRATPGEHVAITPESKTNSLGSDRPIIVQVKSVNVTDHEAAIAAMRSEAGRRTFLNWIQTDAKAVKAALR